MFPLSKYPYITPLLIALSLLVVAALFFMGGAASPWVLVVNWGVAALFAACVWQILLRFKLGGVTEGKAFTISLSLVTSTLNFTYCYFPHTDLFYKGVAQQFALLCVLSLMLSSWQRKQAILKHLFLGLIIGLTSVLIPHALLWLLLLPWSCYHMRSWSIRNALSTVTGVLLGIWIAYCLCFLFEGEAAADAVITGFRIIVQKGHLRAMLDGIGLWQSIFLCFTAVMLVVYSVSAMLLNVGHSMRASASIKLLSTLSLLLVLLLLLDLSHLPTYLGLLSILLSIQLSIHLVNLRSSVNEWWTLVILLVGSALCIAPLFQRLHFSLPHFIDLPFLEYI